jgi:acylphosphatase
MEIKQSRVEIIVKGIVQGVGFRYYILRKANNLKLNGFVKNLDNGDVQIIAEGEKYLLDELINYAKVGPVSSSVESCSVVLSEFKNEFKNFEVRF